MQWAEMGWDREAVLEAIGSMRRGFGCRDR